MCGLIGFFGRRDVASDGEIVSLTRAVDRMSDRGPDGAGLWVHPSRRVVLAHRRLAIIDTSDTGLQPMASADGRLQVVFNGEIYNHRELRARLEAQGAIFRTSTDTEVLLHLYARHGAAMCALLRGMFAFAIHDDRDGSVLLARDGFGIKPLYMHDENGVLRFASQVKALLEAGISSRPDPAGVVGFWLFGHVPEPWTLHRGIRAVPAGHWIRFDPDGGIEQRAFIDAQRNPEGDGPSDSIALADAVADSVRQHLVADVPVGVFLSSGIDSTTLASLAAAVMPRVRTLTVGFDAFRGTPDDEVPLAERFAASIGSEHTTVWLGPEDFSGLREAFLDRMDQPTMDGLNTWMVSAAASRAGLKVALSGCGGDELFAGYPSFRQIPALMRWTGALPVPSGAGRWVRRAMQGWIGRIASPKAASLLEYGTTLSGAWLLRRAMRMPWELRDAGLVDRTTLEEGLDALGLPASLDAVHDGIEPQRLAIGAMESQLYMRNQLLRDTDWAGMAHSLEIRVPLVDTVVAAAVHRAVRAGQPADKAALAACAVPPLPPEIARRPKTGFSVPVREWLGTQGRPQTERGLRGWQREVGEAFGLGA